MKNFYLISLFVISFSLGCGKSTSSTPTSSSTQTYTKKYQATQNACDTGEHQFTGNDETTVLNEYCNALQNEALNNYCAQSSRKSFFDENCSGRTWNPK